MSDPEIQIVEWALGNSDQAKSIMEKLTSLESVKRLSSNDLQFIVGALNRLRSSDLTVNEQIYLEHKFILVRDWLEPIVGPDLL